MNLLKKTRKSIIVLLFYCFITLLPYASQAQDANVKVNACTPGGESGGTLWNRIEACRQCGNCELNDFVIIVINISQWILGIVGSLALLFFVYGGITMIISAGSSEKVQEGKTIFQNAIIGLIIVFVSWTIINFVYYAFVDKTTGNVWYQLR